MRDQQRLLTLCALHHEGLGRIDWKLLARTAQTSEGLDLWYSGEVQERSPKADRAQKLMAYVIESKSALRDAEDFVSRQLEAAADAGAKLVTVLDEEYPANLRLVPDAPPFLFYKGSLSVTDARSIAVVGTRQASNDGLSRARRMASGLSEHGIVVVSGLAKGIDTAAHAATIALSNRTVAVTGSGVASPVYPRENAGLAVQIVETGGCVISQFWPTDSPDRWRFPARNVTMSGYTQGTVVIEASSTSGAKIQAEAARAHSKTVFLLKSLATAQPWAGKMILEALALYPAKHQRALVQGSYAHSTVVKPVRDVDLFSVVEDEIQGDVVHGEFLPLPVVEVSGVADVIARVASAEAITAAAEMRHRMASLIAPAL